MALTYNLSRLMYLQSDLDSQCRPRETASYHWLTSWPLNLPVLEHAQSPFTEPSGGYCLKNIFLLKLGCQHKPPMVLLLYSSSCTISSAFPIPETKQCLFSKLLSSSGLLCQMCYKGVNPMFLCFLNSYQSTELEMG